MGTWRKGPPCASYARPLSRLKPIAPANPPRSYNGGHGDQPQGVCQSPPPDRASGARRRAAGSPTRRSCSTSDRPRPSRPATCPTAVHLDLFGISLIDTDPAPLRAFLWILEHLLATRGVTRRPGPSSCTTSSRACGRPGPSGRSSTSATSTRACSMEASPRGSRPGIQPAPRPWRPWRTSWTGTPVAERVASYRDVLDRLEAPDAVILDTRTDGEYLGTTVRAARGGCIPGAVHVEWTTNLRPDGSFKSADELRALYEPVGVTPDKEVRDLLPGRLPRRARAISRLRLLGYPRVRNYVGSWKEWGDRLELPVQVPNPEVGRGLRPRRCG